MESDRDRFDNEVLQQMLDALESGHDPIEILRVVLALGYSPLDVARLALKFESLLLYMNNMAHEPMAEMTEEQIAEGQKALVAGIEDYLTRQGGGAQL